MDLRKIDALVAEKVLGRELAWVELRRYPRLYIDGGPEHEEMPHYSTDIAAAWQVVEKLKVGSRATEADGWKVQDTLHLRFNNPGWCAGWVYPGADYMGAEHWVHADTAPLAICLAALRAVGVEVEA